MSSKKIRGITVQIGGDTSGLTKALSSADSALRATQKELNEVQKGLKLDPNNAVLMAQKQELLTKAIETTSEKLKVLEANQEKAKKAFEANAEWERRYAPLKEQIDAASKSLKDLKSEQDKAKQAFEEGNISAEDYEKVKADVKEAEKALADLKEQKKQLEAEFENGHISAEQYREYQREVENTRSQLNSLQGELRNTGVSAEEAHKKLGDFGDHAKKTFKDVTKAAAAVTAAILAVGKQAVETGAEFDKGMSQVAATMGYTWEELADEGSEAAATFETLRGFALDMGKSTAFSATQASEALNYMALAGYDAETSIAMLPNVLNLAAAGTMELGTASDMVTDTQTALGLSIGETSALVDKMAETASKSNTSVSQLGSAMLTIGATARDMAGGTTELSASLGILADNGIKGAEGGTKLRNIILALQSPTEKAAKELERLGVNAYDSSGQFRPLRDTLADLDGALAEMSEQDAAIAKSTIFSKRDLAAVNALLGTSADRWNELTQEIDSSAGAAQEMADVQLDNLAGDMTLFQSAVEGAEITISDKLTPSLRNAVQFGTKAVTELADGFGEGGLSGAVEAAHQLIERELGEQAELIFGIETGVKAAAAAFVTYKATMLLSEGISALKTVNTLLAQGKTLTEALNATAAVNPYVLIATAAIAAGTAVKSLIDIQTDLIEEAVDSYDYMNDKQKETVDNVKSLAKTVGESRKSWKENTEAAEKQAEKYKMLSEELYRLDEREQLSAADKERMKAIVSELNGSIDGLNIKLDEETGHLVTQKSTIDALIESYRRQAEAQAMQERYTELYSQQIDAEENLKRATEERANGYQRLNDIQTSLNAAQWEYGELIEKSNAGYQTAEDAARLTELSTLIQQLNSDYVEQEGVVGDLNAAYVSASETVRSVDEDMAALDARARETGEQLSGSADTVSGAADKMGDSFADLETEAAHSSEEIVSAFQTASSKIEAIVNDYNSKLQERTNTLQNWFEVNATVSGDEASFSSLSSALDQQIADMEEWSAGIERLEKEGINENFLDKLKDAGPASLAYVRTLLDVPQKERNEYAKKWDKAYSSASETAEKQLARMREASDRAIQDIINDAEAQGANVEAVFEQLGIYTGDGFIEGLNERMDDVIEAINEEIAQIQQTMEEGLETGSPSRLTKRYGRWFDQGLAIGIEDDTAKAVNAAKALIDDTVNASQSAVKSASLDVPAVNVGIGRAARDYRASQQMLSAEQSSAVNAAEPVKKALEELVSGDFIVEQTIDGDRFARLIVKKIDILQGEHADDVTGGYADV